MLVSSFRQRHASLALKWVVILMTIGIPLLLAPPPLAGSTVSPTNFPSNENQLYRFAQDLYKKGRFIRAAAEFERFLFYYPRDSRISEVRYKVAESYFRADRFQDAADVCQAVIEEASEAAETAKFYLLLSRCQIRQNDFNQALITIHNLLSIYDEPAVQDEARYIGAWVCIETAQWPQAQNWLQAISGPNQERYKVEEITAGLATAPSIPQKDPKVAGLFAVLPGGGHLYTGRYQDALISFVLNGLTIWASCEAFDNDQPALGSLLGLVGINLYTGNIYSAVNSAHKFNRNATGKFIDGLKKKTGIRLSLLPVEKGGMFLVTIPF